MSSSRSSSLAPIAQCGVGSAQPPRGPDSAVDGRTLRFMADLGTWISVAVAVAALIFTVLSYLHRRGRSRLEYVVIVHRRLLPGRVAGELDVTHGGAVVAEPALTVVRIVSVGDQPIRPEDFETDLTVTLDAIQEVVSASWSAVRPADLRPEIEIRDARVLIPPKVINPGDMLELQVLSAGQPTGVSVAGRVAGLAIVEREALPYPPGSGSEGEMLGFDRFMWFAAAPACIIAVGLGLALREGLSDVGRGLTVGGTALVLVAYLIQVAYLVRRRRRWRP